MGNPYDDKDLQGLISEAFPEQMITNWIIIAEVLDNDSRDLHLGTSDGMTTWLGAGMLDCAKEIMMTRELDASFFYSDNDDLDEDSDED
jgi:hypothetical protein